MARLRRREEGTLTGHLVDLILDRLPDLRVPIPNARHCGTADRVDELLAVFKRYIDAFRRGRDGRTPGRAVEDRGRTRAVLSVSISSCGHGCCGRMGVGSVQEGRALPGYTAVSTMTRTRGGFAQGHSDGYTVRRAVRTAHGVPSDPRSCTRSSSCALSSLR